MLQCLKITNFSNPNYHYANTCHAFLVLFCMHEFTFCLKLYLFLLCLSDYISRQQGTLFSSSHFEKNPLYKEIFLMMFFPLKIIFIFYPRETILQL